LANASVASQVSYIDGRILDLFKVSGDTNKADLLSVGLDFGDISIKKCPRRFIFWFEGITVIKTMVLEIDYRNSINEDWSTYVKSFAIENSEQPVKVRPPKAYLFRFRLRDDDINVNWKLVKFEIWGTTHGRRSM